MSDDLTEKVARALVAMHFDGVGCGDSQHPGACSNCYGPSPMNALEVSRTVLAEVADDVDGIAGVLKHHRPRACGCGRCTDCDVTGMPFSLHLAHVMTAYLRGADS